MLILRLYNSLGIRVPERIKLLDVGCYPEAAVSGAVLIQSDISTTLLFNAVQKQGERYVPAGHAVVSFKHCSITKFGYPNDEARSGIPRTKDLSYGFYEVLDSDWTKELEQLNRFAFPSFKRRIERHFLILFHDNSFECLAEDLDVKLSSEPFSALLTFLGHQMSQE